MSKKSSELILNADGSIYHLNLRPEHLADRIITVGDPDRVEMVSKYFDTVDFKTRKREIVTHTGTLNGKRIMAISTGMGTDNIDIVLTELDALANIDLQTGEIKKDHRSLTFLRLGTSGALHKDIPVDSYVLSTHGLGLDGLLHFYKGSEAVIDQAMGEAFLEYSNWDPKKAEPYFVKGWEELLAKFRSDETHEGVTATASGFYGPQGRYLRLEPNPSDINEILGGFHFDGYRITNFEMETSAIYGLSRMLGHRALSCNCIVANRAAGEFSQDTKKSVDEMIRYALPRFTEV